MKILVIGDSCIDKFIYCEINRICPEAPVPILNPLYETTNEGMAGNVVANLKAFNVEVDLLTNHSQIEKIRYIDDKSGQMVMRLDKNDKCKKYHGETYDAVDYDAVIISDYNKGFLSKEDIEAWIERSKCPVFLDTKKKLGPWCKHADFIKINEYEREQSKLYKYDNIIVTRGSKGATYQNKEYPVKSKVKVSNVSGAGDTFVAGLVYSYVRHGLIDNAINFANDCASKVVQERGVTIIT
jgi:bifunctional ADP-heptose synthase (sugar kinase/adenylyltransferase)